MSGKTSVWSDKTRLDLALAILLHHPPSFINWAAVAETAYSISPELEKDKPTGDAMRQVWDKVKKGKKAVGGDGEGGSPAAGNGKGKGREVGKSTEKKSPGKGKGKRGAGEMDAGEEGMDGDKGEAAGKKVKMEVEAEE